MSAPPVEILKGVESISALLDQQVANCKEFGANGRIISAQSAQTIAHLAEALRVLSTPAMKP